MIESPHVRREIPPLTGLRFIAAFLVMYGHTVGFLTPWPEGRLYSTMSVSTLGMSLFFVLSGFVIQWNYSDITRDGWRGVYNFAVARFARLYPLYILFLIAYVSVVPANAIGHLWLTALTYLTLTQSWFPFTFENGVELSRVYLANAWSISTEVALYLAFIPASALLLRFTNKSAVRTAIIFWVIACTVVAVIWWNMSLTNPDFGWGWLTYTSPWWRLMEFGIGALVAKFVAQGDKILMSDACSRDHWIAAVGVLLCCWPLVAQVYVPQGVIFTTWGPAPGIAILIYYVSRFDTVSSRLLSMRTVLICGEASYSIYFFHGWLVPMFGVQKAPYLWLFAIKIGCIWAFAIIASIGFYSVVEYPARAYLRRKLRLPKRQSEKKPEDISMSTDYRA